MHSEIFRFASVRPPQSTAGLAPELPPFVLDAPDSQLIAALRRSQLSGDRASMIRLCAAFVGGSNYLSRRSQVDPALLEAAETLSLLAQTDFQRAAGERIQEILGIAPSAYVKGATYTRSLSAITESIAAACISGAGSARSKELQISVGRALNAIRLLADNRAFGKQEIQASTFVLPSGIFPVPLAGSNLKAQRQQRAEIRSKAALERTRELERLGSDLAGYKSAFAELLQALDVSASNGIPEEGVARTGGFRLATATTQKLTAATKSVLKRSGQSDRDVDVANALANLERRLADTAHELFAKAGTAAPLIRRGNNWFAGIDVELPDFSLVSSRVPGLCPPLSVDGVDVPTPVVGNGKHDVRVVGIADLLMVEQELVRYQYGEISHVENVLKSEFRDRKHRISQLNEDISTIETSTTDLEVERPDSQRTVRAANRSPAGDQRNDGDEHRHERQRFVRTGDLFGKFQLLLQRLSLGIATRSIGVRARDRLKDSSAASRIEASSATSAEVCGKWRKPISTRSTTRRAANTSPACIASSTRYTAPRSSTTAGA